MASCLFDAHIWSLSASSIIIPDEEVGVFCYHDKHEAVSAHHPYLEEKIAYTEGRNVTWVPRNKRPEKLKDSLKEVEELLASYKCISCKWLTRGVLQLMLSNGTIIYIIVCMHSGDVDRFIIDRTLSGKLSADNTCHALLTDFYMAVCYPDRPKLDFICYMRRPETLKKFEKLSAYDPKIQSVDLPGPVGRKLRRQLTCSMHLDLFICWWPMTSDEAVPWSPMSEESQRANLALYKFNGLNMERIAFIRTDCDPLNVTFSSLHHNIILTLEQSTASGGEINIDSCIYEFSSSQISRISVTTIAIQSYATCFDRSALEDKILLGCDDSSIVLYDEQRKLTSAVNSVFVPNFVRWHPSNTVIVAANSRGHVQIFDLALNPLLVELVSENPEPMRALNLSPYIRTQSSVQHVEWSPSSDQMEPKLPECNDTIFMLHDKGLMMVLQLYTGTLSQGVLSPLSLIHEHINHDSLASAVTLLSGLNWNLESSVAFACLSTVANHLLKSPLNATNEDLLEKALGSFYAPSSPLHESVVLEYREPISKLARRFFHQLLRFTRFEKAYLLAVDIGSRDLFMDLHYVAKDKGEMALAEVSRRKADHLSLESRASGSYDENEASDLSSELSQEESYSGSDVEYIEGAPPRPPRSISSSKSLGKPLLPSPPPSAAYSPRSPHLMDVSRVLLHDLEADLMAGAPPEFQDALHDSPLLPPPASHADPQPDPNSASKVKVIHFGLV